MTQITANATKCEEEM